jgi:hypothetical protein
MRCHVCNVAVGDGQRFCHECGESLDGVTNPTEIHPAIDADAVAGEHQTTVLLNEALAPPVVTDVLRSDPAPDQAGMPLATEVDLDDASWWATEADEPDLAPTEAIEAIAEPADRPLEPSDRFDTPRTGVSSALSTMPFEEPKLEPAPVLYEATTTMPAMGAAVFDGAGDADDYAPPPPEGFKLRATFVFSFLTMVATLMASVADIIDIRTSRPVDGIVVGIRMIDDVGTNLAVAGFIGAAIMLVGGRPRWRCWPRHRRVGSRDDRLDRGTDSRRTTDHSRFHDRCESVHVVNHP